MSNLNRIQQLIRDGRKSDARDLLFDYLQENPHSEQGWLYMAAAAANKTEFISSIKRVLEINPHNSQAQALAQRYNISVPQPAPAFSPSPDTAKRRRKAAAKRGGGRGLLRVLLLLLVLVALGALALLFFLNDEDDDPQVVDSEVILAEASPESTALATAELSAEASPLATAEVLLPTEDVASPSPTEESATPTVVAATEAAPSPEASAEVEVALASSPEASPEAEARPSSTATRRPSATPAPSATPTEASTEAALVLAVAVAGNAESIGVDAAIPVVVELDRRETEVNVQVLLEQDSAPATLEEAVPAGAPRVLVLTLPAPAEGWTPGTWPITVQVDGAVVDERQLEIIGLPEAATDTTPEATADATADPSPESADSSSSGQRFDEDNATLKVVYNAERAYVMNLAEENQDISLLRFVQEAPDADLDVEAMIWQRDTYRGPGSVYALQPDSCFQVGLDINAASIKARECVRLTSWQRASEESAFWTALSPDAESFDLYWGEDYLTTCAIGLGEDDDTCYFAVPLPEED